MCFILSKLLQHSSTGAQDTQTCTYILHFWLLFILVKWQFSHSDLNSWRKKSIQVWYKSRYHLLKACLFWLQHVSR